MSLDPNILVVATSARNEFEGNALVAALQARGITATVFGVAAATMQWEAGYTDPYKVMVRREDEALARTMIDEIRSKDSGIEWSQVDVAAQAERLAAGMVCWACGHRLGGLEAQTRICPKCSAEIFPEDDTPPEAAAAPGQLGYAQRMKTFRQTGLALVLIPTGVGIVASLALGIERYPLLGLYLGLCVLVIVIRLLLKRA